ncbi:hypothetical protein M9H77_32275 [Catharanthus roseus]|uniref:Uncharacterized protein n=1 Tax=Catharanthus roseus TaxID=4058 RepID=A0ACC0A6P2_CATRO|nr:hypothetical protein M9H77_32275 [Catharanthus roseus]
MYLVSSPIFGEKNIAFLLMPYLRLEYLVLIQGRLFLFLKHLVQTAAPCGSGKTWICFNPRIELKGQVDVLFLVIKWTLFPPSNDNITRIRHFVLRFSSMDGVAIAAGERFRSINCFVDQLLIIFIVSFLENCSMGLAGIRMDVPTFTKLKEPEELSGTRDFTFFFFFFW